MVSFLSFLLGISLVVNVVFVIALIVFLRFKNKIDPLKKIEKFYKNDIEDKSAFTSFFGGM